MIHSKQIFPLSFCCLFLASCTQPATQNKREPPTTGADTSIEQARIIADFTNRLTGTVETLTVEYVVGDCVCPDWMEANDKKGAGKTKKNEQLPFYIEPADKSLTLPIYFDAFRHQLSISGQFYEKAGYPQGTAEPEASQPKARVFRYTSLAVVNKPGFRPGSKVETLTLTYNAISCTCAKWSDSQNRKYETDRHYYWLEPANEKLIKADTLFNGTDLPVIIRVTGQVVSENGFPKTNLSKVSPEEAGTVFRYTNIDVLRNGERKKN
ncbi:MAG: hypothetical protein J0M10_06275 [Chitinophagales bacterium]|nr:hypothetical protein [Chitinophagales bacterium]